VIRRAIVITIVVVIVIHWATRINLGTNRTFQHKQMEKHRVILQPACNSISYPVSRYGWALEAKQPRLACSLAGYLVAIGIKRDKLRARSQGVVRVSWTTMLPQECLLCAITFTARRSSDVVRVDPLSACCGSLQGTRRGGRGTRRTLWAISME
jgi:hypothetical protein